MGNTIKAIRRGIKASVDAIHHPQPHQFQTGGKTVVCSQCNNDTFDLVGMMGLSAAGYGIQCSKCSHREYFGKKLRELA